MLKFTVGPETGNPYVLTATARDVLTWERSGAGRAFSSLKDSLKMGDLYEIAFYAARRQGLYTQDRKSFETECDLTLEDDDDMDPTSKAASHD